MPSPRVHEARGNAEQIRKQWLCIPRIRQAAPRASNARFLRVCSRAAPDEGGAPRWGQRLVHLSGISAGAIDRSIPSLGCQGASVWRALARQLASFHARKHGYALGWLAARRRKRSRLTADVLSFSHAAL